MRKLFRSRKALSPVVAAIILIAVTVAVSIAVAAWMGALTFTFMKTEELRISSHTWASDASNIVLNVTNTGTARLTISEVRVNDESYGEGTGDEEWECSATDNVLEPGDKEYITIRGPSGGFTKGAKYEFAIITATGNKFLYTAVAPS